MKAITDFSFSFARGLGSKAGRPEPLLKRAALERIATGLSLISQAVGFSIIGLLILATRHQAELNDSANGGFLATVGGISALFVGIAFLIAALLYWRFCAKRSAGLAFRRKTACLNYARPELTTAIASLALTPIGAEGEILWRTPLTFTVPAYGFIVAAII
jgi:hypothetical protein